MALKASLVFLAFLVFVAIFEPLGVQSKDTKPTGQGGFNFLQHLKGCHKGQTVQGLHELKQYLSNFGYLHYPQYSTKTNVSHATDDEFDNLLESAIKTYQKFYHLNVTGNLDSNTVDQMKQSRCGMPDIIIEGTKPKSSHRKMKHGHDHSKGLHTVSHYSFIPGMPKWRPSKTHLTYSFRSGVQVVDQQVLSSVCSRAFKRWQDVTQFTFEEAPQGSNGDLVIGFQRGNHGDGSSFDGTLGILAHAFQPEIGVFHYDADERWSTNPGVDQVDLESVAVHEIGHLLGLAHSQDQTAIMFATFSYGTVKRDLQPDDIQGIRALYS